MKDAALVPVGIAAWQTPRNGDFALYVEQLTGGQAHVTLDEPGRVPRWSESRRPLASSRDNALQILVQQRAGQQAVPATQGGANDAQVARRAGSEVLGKVQAGIFLLTVLQVIVLVAFNKGSMTVVVASALMWWLAGRAKRVLDGSGEGQNAKAAAKNTARRERLERLVAQQKRSVEHEH